MNLPPARLVKKSTSTPEVKKDGQQQTGMRELSEEESRRALESAFRKSFFGSPPEPDIKMRLT